MYSLGFISNDNILVNELRKVDSFEGFFLFNRLEDVKEIDVLIISDKIVSINELINSNVKMKAQHLFYMVSNENYSDQIKEVVKALNYNYIPPKLTAKQIIEQITLKLLNNVKKTNENVIVFFGADNKVGTTTIAQSVAEFIAHERKQKVLLMFLGGTKGTDYTQNIIFNGGLDDLKIKLYNRILNVNELGEILGKDGQLHILAGTNSIDGRRHYHPEHIEYLIELVSNKYDLVIIDAGANIELGMAIGSLNAANYRFLVANQKSKTLNAFLQVNEQAFSKFNMNNFFLIVNQYLDNPYLTSPINIADSLKLTLISTVKYEELGWQSENEHKTLLNYNLPDFEHSIKKIIPLISKSAGFECQISTNIEQTFFEKIRKKIVALGGR